MRFVQKCRARGADLFDIDVDENTRLHPNVRVVGMKKNAKGVLQDERNIWFYMNKSNKSVGTFKDPKATLKAAIKGQGKGDSAYAYALQADTAEEFQSRVAQLAPRDYVIFNSQLQSFVQTRYAPPKKEYTPSFTEFPHVPREMREWVETEFKKTDRPKSLVVYGPTRLGKTEWARSLGKHNFQSGLFNLDEFDESADYIVLDDISMQFFPSYKSWLGAQKEFNQTDKYRRKQLVRWGKPCIWLSNDDPRNAQGVDREWLDGNCIFVHLTHKLYDVAPPRVIADPAPTGSQEGLFLPDNDDIEWPTTPRAKREDFGVAEDGRRIVYLEDFFICVAIPASLLSTGYPTAALIDGRAPPGVEPAA
ncbi:hypothetical protein NUW54_g11928 [Trametes sanguinea]|uniref:Uncharacterized protein n=1 Tax=Trametes sanguinea TaxID=158606 RepID=A0ACC1N4K5_9APHY|nr:hypothetical protein NUW54_g11928 [Trametes sanguinea]